MRCRECGCSTRVAETRSDPDGVVNRRRRICTDAACGQQFWTFELDDMVAKTITGRIMVTHKAAVLKRREIGLRHKEVAARLLAGERVGQIAKSLGVSQSTVSRIGNKRGFYSRGPYSKR